MLYVQRKTATSNGEMISHIEGVKCVGMGCAFVCMPTCLWSVGHQELLVTELC